MIKVSVIVPVYNVEEYIEECILSILNQTLKDIEIIIIDDGSTDSSLEKVRVFNDSRIKIICQKNSGLSSARNKGIEAAKGEYILFIDSDDFISRTSLEDMYNLAISNNSDIVVGNANKYFSENNIEPIYRDKDEFFKRTLLSDELIVKLLNSNSMQIAACFNLYKRRLLIDNNLYFKVGVLHEDELFTPLAFLKSKKITIYPEEFYNYRQRPKSIMSTKNDKRGQDIIDICSVLLEEYSKIKNKDLKRRLEHRTYDLILSTCKEYKKVKISKRIRNFLIFNFINIKKYILSVFIVLNNT